MNKKIRTKKTVLLKNRRSNDSGAISNDCTTCFF